MRKLWLRGGLNALQGNTINGDRQGHLPHSYSIKWGVAATENKSPNEGYKEKGPTNVIQTELSKLGYISIVGEMDTGDLGEIRNT